MTRNEIRPFGWIFILWFSFSSCQSDLDDTTEPITEPYENDQWYLTGSQGRTTIGLTKNTYSGQGVLIAIVDDGLDIYHEDLVNNIGDGNYSYLPESFDFTDAKHGTACAGIIAAESGNGLGIRGIAPNSKIIAFNALATPSISNLADALQRNKEKVWISNNSWGDFNSWGEPLGLRHEVEQALMDGVEHGRNGKGIVYVFSAGNGNSFENDLPTDNVNYSGLVNNRYTIPVAATDDQGIHASYSEVGATLVVSAPSLANGGDGITTTDVTDSLGYNPEFFEGDNENLSYTHFFSGTSASAPMVSGVSALVLEANNDLGWRDVKSILALSAKKNDENDPGWVKNGAGHWVNHKYGFGLVQADQAIELAKTWTNYSHLSLLSYSKKAQIGIPDYDDKGISDTITVQNDISIEFIDVVVDIPTHTSIGDLQICLLSPSGTVSVLAETHKELFAGAFRYKGWRFGTFRHLEEYSKGSWVLCIKDLRTGNFGKLESWSLIIYGH